MKTAKPTHISSSTSATTIATPSSTPNTPPKLIRRQAVEALTALSRSTIYDRINAQSPRYDASFPQPIKIGLAAVRWVESEIHTWIADRISGTRAT
jgi:prophage regulatory protein